MRRDTSLRFDPRTHRYWLGTRELFAVTRISGRRDSSTRRGGARPRVCAGRRSIEPPKRRSRRSVAPLDASDRPYLEAYEEFRRDVRPVWHGIETPVADPCLGYAGRPDRWGSCQGEPVVVDLEDGHGPRLGAVAARRLRAARLDAAGSCRRRRLVVHLLPTGRYALREYPIVNFGRDERVFLAALAVTQWKAAAA